MDKRGGPRPGSGRKRGSLTKRTQLIAQALIETPGWTPLEYMLHVLRDENSSTEDRKWAANAAAPYIHSRLATIESKVTGSIEVQLRELIRDAK